MVLRAKPRRDDVNFTRHRRRPHVVLSDGTAVPTTAGQCKHNHLLPSPTNGLWKPSDLILNIRCNPKRGYAYDVIGCLSDAELLFVEQMVSIYQVDTYLDLRS